MRISDWSSDVCSSDLDQAKARDVAADEDREALAIERDVGVERIDAAADRAGDARAARGLGRRGDFALRGAAEEIFAARRFAGAGKRSEEHTSELQSLMRISYAVFCLKKKKRTDII